MKKGKVVNGFGFEFMLARAEALPGLYSWVKSDQPSDPEHESLPYMVHWGAGPSSASAPARVSTRGRPRLKRKSDPWALHGAFAALDGTEDGVAGFVAQWGLLGVDQRLLKVSPGEWSGWREGDDPTAGFDDAEHWEYDPASPVSVLGESLALWRHHIQKVSTLIRVFGAWRRDPTGTWFEAFNSWQGRIANAKQLTVEIADGVDVSMPYILSWRGLNSGQDAFEAALSELEMEISRGVRLRVAHGPAGPYMHMACLNLLANIYVALAREVMQQKEVGRQCRCGRWFVPSRKGQVHCCDSCRTAKAREAKGGNTGGETTE